MAAVTWVGTIEEQLARIWRRVVKNIHVFILEQQFICQKKQSMLIRNKLYTDLTEIKQRADVGVLEPPSATDLPKGPRGCAGLSRYCTPIHNQSHSFSTIKKQKG